MSPGGKAWAAEIPEEELCESAGERPPRKGWRVMAPVPCATLRRVRRLGLRAVLTLLAVHLLAGLKRRRSDLPLWNWACREVGLNRQGKCAGLAALEAAGVVSVVRGVRKTPLVTLLEA